MASTSDSLDPMSDLDNRCNDSIYLFYKPTRDPKSEIIFFNDIIDWNNDNKPYLETWMTSSETPVCWPKVWLSKEFPESRISSAYCKGDMWNSKTARLKDIHLIAENLRQDIVDIYKTNCPVFLVGHGLGGLVIKLLVHNMGEKLALEERGSRLSSFLENIQGVFFYNTPFLGSQLADDAKESSLLALAKPLSEEASRLNEWFSIWRMNSGCRSEVIFAACQSKVDVWYGHRHTHVAKEGAVRYDVDDLYTAACSDHFNVCKPKNKIDNRFQNLVRFLTKPRRTRETGPAPTPEDHSEIESKIALTKIVSAVQKTLKGQGLFVLVEYLEKIRKFPGTDRLLADCFEDAGMTKMGGDAKCELWIRRLKPR